MKATLIPILVGTLGTIPVNLDKSLRELKIRERIETV